MSLRAKIMLQWYLSFGGILLLFISCAIAGYELHVSAAEPPSRVGEPAAANEEVSEEDAGRVRWPSTMYMIDLGKTEIISNMAGVVEKTNEANGFTLAYSGEPFDLLATIRKTYGYSVSVIERPGDPRYGWILVRLGDATVDAATLAEIAALPNAVYLQPIQVYLPTDTLVE